MIRRISRFVLIAAFLLLVLIGQAQDSVGQAVLDRINLARNQAGIPSLLVSVELTAAAQRHSNDMAVTQNLSHVGSDNSQFWQRMQDAGYALTTGAENILFRNDLDANGVYLQWHDSPPHEANMMSAAYVEVGIAYTQASNGAYYFTLVLGTRPDVLPPPLPTDLPTLTPTPPFTAIPTVEPIITATPITPLPPTVTLDSSLAITPTITPTFSANHDTLQQALADAFTNYNNALLSDVRVIPTATFTPFVIPTSVIEPTSILPTDLLMIYDTESVTLINTRLTAISLDTLNFESSNGRFEGARWIPYLPASAGGTFPAGSCLQIWRTETPTFPVLPAQCTRAEAYIVTGPAGQFWRNATIFLVNVGSETAAICETGLGFCNISLNARIATPRLLPNTPIPLTFVPLEEGLVDVRLIYNADTFLLINTSGEPLDVSQFSFHSDKSDFIAENWQAAPLSRPLSALPSGDCLQLWELGQPDQERPIDQCRYRHGWIKVPSTQKFWMNADTFIVEDEGVPIAVCEFTIGICEFNIPPENPFATYTPEFPGTQIPSLTPSLTPTPSITPTPTVTPTGTP